jgi:hypothetical protein
VSLIAVPGVREVTHLSFVISDSVALFLAVLCSASLLVIPLFLAFRRVKNLEF